jgi:hypothetical protein
VTDLFSKFSFDEIKILPTELSITQSIKDLSASGKRNLLIESMRIDLPPAIIMVSTEFIWLQFGR